MIFAKWDLPDGPLGDVIVIGFAMFWIAVMVAALLQRFRR